MKLDLNHYGLIGFQREWRALQGEKGSNLLERFVDDCIDSGVDACVVTSEEYQIPRFSVHDRFGILKRIAQRKPTGLSFHRDELGPEYISMKICNNYLEMEKDTKRILLFNSQAARITESEEKIVVLLFGDNSFSDQGTFSQNTEYLKRDDLVIIPKKLTQYGYYPKNKEKAREILFKHKELYDAVVGFDAQAKISVNEESKEIALKVELPYVAISNKHSFSGCRTCIEIPDDRLNYEDEKSLLNTIKKAIRTRKFKNHEYPEGFLTGLKWKLPLLYGIKSKKQLNYQP